MLVEGVLFLAVLLIIVYITVQFISGKATYQGGKAVYDLSKENTLVLQNKDLSWSPRPCTLRFGILVEQAPKTLAKVDCVDIPTTGPVVSFAPSCADYAYKTCVCSGADCGRCALTDGYMSKLLNIGDNLEFWASGYTNQNDKPYVPALLKIRTAQDSAQHMMEAIALPAIPLQRWTIVTVVKEGRRFDVYYGAKLQVSKLCDYVPVPPDGSRQWFSGNRNWKGKIGFFNGSGSAARHQDVEKDVAALVNTRGVPFYMDQVTFDFTSIQTPACLFGDCNKLPDVKPPNPFAVYASSVS